MFYICKFFYKRCSSSTEVMLRCTSSLLEKKSKPLHCISFFDCRWKWMSGGICFAKILLHEFWNCSCFRCLYCLLLSLSRASWLLNRWPARFSSVFQEEIVFGMLTCDLKLRWEMSDDTSHSIAHLPSMMDWDIMSKGRDLCGAISAWVGYEEPRVCQIVYQATISQNKVTNILFTLLTEEPSQFI